MKVGVLTGGGDCPGLNAVIRAVTRTVHNAGGQTLGLLEGWRGAIEGDFIPLHPENTDAIIDRGGTILGSSRTNPYKNEEDVVSALHCGSVGDQRADQLAAQRLIETVLQKYC